MGKIVLRMRKAWIEGQHPRDGDGQFASSPDTGRNPPEKNIGTADAEDSQRKSDIQTLSQILETGKSEIIHNINFGDISFDAGHTGKSGYGLKHLIERRNKKEKKTDEEITAICIAVLESARNGSMIRDEIYIDGTGNDKGVYLLEKEGVIAVISKMRFEDKEQFVITGYENKKNERKATDTIKKVISQYGYTPEFSSLKTQVGAVLSSLPTVSSNALKKSSSRILIKRKAARFLLQKIGGGND